MGYKLAGFDVIGCNDIDESMMKAYITNHNPKYSFLEGIQTLKSRSNLPKELFELDILDGSPPCSSFSMAGNREDDWGEEKKFREGQADQVLDTLFFDFIDLAKRLQPKVVIAENVKGLIMGQAVEYVKKINDAFQDAGYEMRIQPYLLDSSKMGVPQKRERVFFIALRKDLAGPFMEQLDMFQFAPKLDLEFNEKPIYFNEIYQQGISSTKHKQESRLHKYWKQRLPSDNDMGDIVMRLEKRKSMATVMLIHNDRVCQTFTRQDRTLLYEEYRSMNKEEACMVQTFPLDYKFVSKQYGYIIGMSVPPVMISHIASNIYEQWLSKIKMNVFSLAAIS